MWNSALFIAWIVFNLGAHGALPAKPVEHWRLTASSVSQGAFVSSCKGRALTFSTAPEFVGEGEFQALLLRPGADYLVVDAAATPADLPTKSISLEAWVSIDEAPDWGGILSCVEDNGAEESGWLLGTKGRHFAFGLASEKGRNLTYLLSETSFEAGRWYHVVGTYDGKQQAIYVNGELEAKSVEQAGKIHYSSTHEFVVGAYKDRNERHSVVGALHELRLYDRSITPRDVRQQYKRTSGRLPAPEGNSFNGVESAEDPVLRKLQPGINAAIDRGVEALLLEQHRDGSWERSIEVYRNGQTALCVYTLLKSGLHREHPAIRRALGFLRRQPVEKTYSAGFLLLALAATGDPAHREWAQELVDTLEDWESDVQPGAWAYPTGRADLSNTQLVALGLWAASSLGAESSARVWKRMVDSTLEDHMRDPIQVPREKGDKSPRREMAGFTYFKDDRTYNPSGSMATAGICVLSLAERVVGKEIGGRSLRSARRGVQLAVEWLAANWTVQRNPGYKQNEGYYYYLYGIERVGAFLGIDRIGGHSWYPEGARELIKRQKEDGSWGKEEETCFALLFLGRASHAQTGAQAKAKNSVYANEGGPVRLRATGQGTITLWIDGFSTEVLERFLSSEARFAGLRILRVEVLLDGEVCETLPGADAGAWAGERYASRHRFEAPGTHRFALRVFAIPPGVDSRAVFEPLLLSSAEIEVDVVIDARAFMERMTSYEGENLLTWSTRVDASASSQSASSSASQAVDQLEATRWLCGAEDTLPQLSLKFSEAIKTRALRLTPAASKLAQRASYDRVKRLSIVINGKGAFEVEVPDSADELDPIEVSLAEPLRIRSLEITILERDPASGHPGQAGFAEVILLGPR